VGDAEVDEQARLPDLADDRTLDRHPCLEHPLDDRTHVGILAGAVGG
jgi:hypothetical protein